MSTRDEGRKTMAKLVVMRAHTAIIDTIAEQALRPVPHRAEDRCAAD